MVSKTIVRKNEYYDSVTLMSLSGKILKLEGVEEAVVSMATAMNKELLANIGMLTDEAQGCGDNDLIIALKVASDEKYNEALKLVNELLTSKNNRKKGNVENPKTIAAAVRQMKDANLAVISVPGAYAAREARIALDNNLHVMLFSDNVTLEQEKALKEYAREKGLLVMGPDCGTSIINNIGLCFANKVRRGNIGIVGASGTGLQEVMVLIDKLGGGISQAIGTGGRDLHEEIGGIMMIEGLKALNADEATEVIVLVSKPPAKAVEDDILKAVKAVRKPVVVCFIEGDSESVEKAGAVFGYSLEDTAKKAVRLSGISIDDMEHSNGKELEQIIEAEKSKLNSEQKYVRGLFCGGTLCAEALYVLRRKLGSIRSNVAKKEEEKLRDISKSEGNVVLDLGDDVFTVGKPHPMIEPSLRLDRILKEAADKAVGVLLLDFELGYGSHKDPVGITIPAIREAKEAASRDGRHLAVVGYICGTVEDMQNFKEQERMLLEEGVILAGSNVQAAEIAGSLLA